MTRLPGPSVYNLFEPFVWLFYCFFQPSRFKDEFEPKGLLNFRRIIPMLRLLPIFLCLYFILIVVRITLSNSFPNFSFPLDENILSGLAIAIIGGLTLGFVGNLTLGIIGSLVLDIVIVTTLGIPVESVKADIFALIAGLLFGLVETSGLSLTVFAISGLTLGIAEGTLASIVGCIALSTAGGIMLFFIRQSRKLTGIFIGSIIGAFVWFMNEKVLMKGSIDDIKSIFSGAIFVISYMLGYYRIPLYIISGPSSLKAYLASDKDPSQVFTYLNRSSLYWDECVFLPLPKIKEMLLIAYERDHQKTLDLITFIIHEKPQQAISAQAASLEIVLRDLELSTTLSDIAQASPLLVRFLLPEADLIELRYILPLSRLNDASRDATSFFNLLGRRSRLEALENMKTSLKTISFGSPSADRDLLKRFTKLAKKWLAICETELAHVEQDLEKKGSIHNPYAVGPVLKPGDHLFVGRQDLALQLEEALGKGNYRPTFFLFGERRMGKSSTLLHLPNLLGSRHIPIFYDLEAPGILASVVTLLTRMAQEIYEEVSTRGIKIKKLHPSKLSEANQASEAQVYYEFDEWLKELEYVLKREDRILLLTFDEFERLQETEMRNNLNINLLLSWFRSIIQHRSRIALLFSGIHTIADMQLDWAGYFVNVQTLKVSFLSLEDASQLITHPAPDFPGEQIFGKDIVAEVIKITGRHPFLIQAVCSALINHINTQHRIYVEKQDITIAIRRVLDSLGSAYFRDLWDRTDEAQQVCLMALVSSDGKSLSQIEQQCSIAQERVYQAIDRLISRDLVEVRKDLYCISIPILSIWIESNKRPFTY